MTPMLLALAVQTAVPAPVPAISVPRIVIPPAPAPSTPPPSSSPAPSPSPAPSALPASAAAPVLGAIGRQALPASGCAAYLWTRDEPHRLVAMATAEAGLLRLAVDGRPVELRRTTAAGAVAHGLAASTGYAAADVNATLDLTVADREGLSAGATVPDAVLRVERPGRDALVMPLAGLIGCR